MICHVTLFSSSLTSSPGPGQGLMSALWALWSCCKSIIPPSLQLYNLFFKSAPLWFHIMKWNRNHWWYIHFCFINIISSIPASCLFPLRTASDFSSVLQEWLWMAGSQPATHSVQTAGLIWVKLLSWLRCNPSSSVQLMSLTVTSHILGEGHWSLMMMDLSSEWSTRNTLMSPSMGISPSVFSDIWSKDST